jgi:hypothetical protein
MDADVQPDGIVDRCDRMCAAASDHQKERRKRSLGPHGITTGMEVREEQVSEFIGKSLQPNWIPRLLIAPLTAN